MKKIILAILAALILFVIAVKVKISESEMNLQQTEKKLVKIGAILPLSGNMAVWGQSFKNGIMIAESHLPNNSKYDYEFIFEDNADKIKNTQSLALKLINVDKVQALITAFDPSANIAGPLAAENNILHFGSSWFPDFVKNKYNFSVYTDIADEAELMALKMVQENLHKTVLFTVNQGGFEKGIKLLKQALLKNGIEICDEIKFNLGQRDFKMDIAKAKECSPDIYVISAFAPEADIITKQLKELSGNDVKITGLDLGLNAGNLSLYESYWYTAPRLPGKLFMDQYLKSFNDNGYLYGAPIAYDQAMAIVYGFEKTPSPVNTQTIALTIQNALGIPSAYGRNSPKQKGIFHIPTGLMTIRDGKLFPAE